MDHDGSDYLKRAADLVRRWTRYAPLHVVLDMPDNRRLEETEPRYVDWHAGDEDESTWTFRYAGHPLDGVTIPRELYYDTFRFAWHKNQVGMIVGQPYEVFSHIFATEDRTRRLTIEDLRPYIPDICA